MNIDLNLAQQLIDMLADAAIRVIETTRTQAPEARAKLGATRVRRTREQMAVDNAAAAPVVAPVAAVVEPVAPAPAPVAETPPAPAPKPVPKPANVNYATLRGQLIAAVRVSLGVNGEEDTVSRLGYANISSVPNEELPATIERVSA